MAAKQKRELCVNCRSPEDLTRDHIPPKSFFPKPRPNNLITVPCCRTCHKEFTENDEYLRNYLIFSSQCRGHAAARQLQENGLLSLQDPNAGELSNPLFNTCGAVLAWESGRVHLPPGSRRDCRSRR